MKRNVVALAAVVAGAVVLLAAHWARATSPCPGPIRKALVFRPVSVTVDGVAQPVADGWISGFNDPSGTQMDVLDPDSRASRVASVSRVP